MFNMQCTLTDMDRTGKHAELRTREHIKVDAECYRSSKMDFKKNMDKKSKEL